MKYAALLMLPIIGGCAPEDLPPAPLEHETRSTEWLYTNASEIEPGEHVDVIGRCTDSDDSTFAIVRSVPDSATVSADSAIIFRLPQGLSRDSMTALCNEPLLRMHFAWEPDRYVQLADAPVPPYEASLVELIADPENEQFEELGTISVRGFCSVADGVAYLFMTADDVRYGNTRPTITLEFESRNQAARCDGTFVSVYGKYRIEGNRRGRFHAQDVIPVATRPQAPQDE